jgi:NADH-quinone oxidoreductase subunit H
VPFSSNFIIFIIAPLLTLILSLLNWSIIPFDFKVVISDIDLGLFFLLAFSSLGVHGIILSGWASNSKYSFLGSLRAAAQLISYEICLSIIILPVILYAESANLSLIVLSQDYVWNITILLPSFFLFFICILAETNRVPFDLPEAESELVSGYNVEYSAVTFVFFFLAEYSNILLMSSLTVCLFLGGWLPLVNFIYLPGYIWFVIKLCFIVFFFIWIRATLPRLRYDQLMSLGWKIVLPVSLFVFFFVTFILLSIRYILC